MQGQDAPAPGQRQAEEEYRKRAFPLKQIPPEARRRALAETQQADLAGAKGPFITYWYNIGPKPLDEINNGQPQQVSGRVAALAVDPSNSSHWLLGAAQGGVWETTDDGTTWAPRSDDQASLAMGALAFAPSNPLLVYAGTGEANFSADAFAGQGLLVSHDGGTTWQMLNPNFAETGFSRIQVSASDANQLSVATARGVEGVVAHGTNIPPTAPLRGIFVSTTGGVTFTRKLTGEATALEVDPSNFNHQYAALGEIYGAPTNGVYRTTDGWSTWQTVNGPWTSTASDLYGRIALAVSTGSPSTLYVAITYASGETYPLVGIWRTDNAWDPTPVWTALPDPDPTLVGPYSWYSLALQVDPSNANKLYLAALDLIRYASGAWSGDLAAAEVSVDQHALAWVPAGASAHKLLLGNDHGLWLSDTSVSGNWQDLNASLATVQIYKGAVDPTGVNPLSLQGCQDNGSAAYTGDPAWKVFLGGDGCDCAISSAHPLLDWASCLQSGVGNIGIFRTKSGGADFALTADGIDNSDPPFFVHFEKSPNNNDVFIAGTSQLWRCDNFFTATTPKWKSNSPSLTDTNGLPVFISAMAFAPSDTASMTYAFGTEDGQLRITSDGGTLWYHLDPANGVPNRFITGLAFNPTNANILYVSISGFDESTPGHAGHLFRTTNSLAATPVWTNVSPPVDVPNDCVAIDPNSPSTIYVGTDIGVWTTSDAAKTWSHYGPSSGMPNVAVFDLRLDSNSEVTAFTHGRGAFVLKSVNIPQVVYAVPPYLIPLGCGDCPPSPCFQCPPGELWINPGDLVTIQLPLQNVLPIETVDLKVTMLATPGITPITGTQDYGVLIGQGLPVTRAFSFQAGLTGETDGFRAPCGGATQVVFQLSDQGTNLGQVIVPFHLGTPFYPLSENFEQAPLGQLPSGWTSSATGGGVPWSTTSNQPPNEIFGGVPDEPNDESFPLNSAPNNSVFTPDTLGLGQSLLTSPVFPVRGALAQLFFRQTFLVSPTNDGCVLEVAIGGQPFVEITQAGGSFAQDAYNVILSDRNPLGPRAAWSGDSGGWLPVWVNLPATAAGQPVQFRWHFATSVGTTNGAWFIDSVRVLDPLCLPPVSDPIILRPTVQGNFFTFAINTVAGRTYILEQKADLKDTTWQFLQTLTGDGTQQSVQTPLSPAGRRFYRFRVQ